MRGNEAKSVKNHSRTNKNITMRTHRTKNQSSEQSAAHLRGAFQQPVKSAVESGELDQSISSVADLVRARFKK
jgi:hypothetical protein